MNLTPAAGDLLAAAAARSDRMKRRAALIDARAAASQKPDAFNKILRALER